MRQWEDRIFELTVQHVPSPEKLAEEFGANWTQRFIPESNTHKLPSRTFHASSFNWIFEARKGDYVYHSQTYLDYRESNSEKYSLMVGLPVSTEWCVNANRLRSRLKSDGWRFVVIPGRFGRNHPENAFYEKTQNHEITRVWKQQNSACLFFISIIRHHAFSGRDVLDFSRARIVEPN